MKTPTKLLLGAAGRLLLAALFPVAGCTDPGAPHYADCVRLQAQGDLRAAAESCRAAVDADPGSKSGQLAEQKLLVEFPMLWRQRAERQDQERKAADEKRVAEAAQPPAAPAGVILAEAEAPGPPDDYSGPRMVAPGVFSTCEGEGCGCTDDKTTNGPATLHLEMDVRSKVVAKLDAGARAKLIRPLLKVLAPGRMAVTAVHDKRLGLRTGDVLTLLIGVGEGLMQARKANGRWVRFEDEISYETMEETKLEQWWEIKAGPVMGYSETFPFRECGER